MISIEENYKLVQDLLSKNNGIRLTPKEYSRYATLASNDRYDKMIGAKDLNSVAYGNNRTLDRRLHRYRKIEDLTLTGGRAMQPADLELTRSVYYTNNGKRIPVRVIDEDRFAKLFQDPLAYPTLEDPVYIEDDGSIRVFPENIAQVTVEYLRRPATPKYGYTIQNRRPVYDPTSSVDIDWDIREENEITMRILQFAAVALQNGQLVQYTETKQVKE